MWHERKSFVINQGSVREICRQKLYGSTSCVRACECVKERERECECTRARVCVCERLKTGVSFMFPCRSDSMTEKKPMGQERNKKKNICTGGRFVRIKRAKVVPQHGRCAMSETSKR